MHDLIIKNGYIITYFQFIDNIIIGNNIESDSDKEYLNELFFSKFERNDEIVDDYLLLKRACVLDESGGSVGEILTRHLNSNGIGDSKREDLVSFFEETKRICYDHSTHLKTLGEFTNELDMEIGTNGVSTSGKKISIHYFPEYTSENQLMYFLLVQWFWHLDFQVEDFQHLFKVVKVKDSDETSDGVPF